MHFGRALYKQAFYFRRFPGLVISRFSSSPLDYIPESPETCRTKTIGWVQSIRRHKTKTFLNVNDGTSSTNLQVSCFIFSCFIFLFSWFSGVVELWDNALPIYLNVPG